MEFLDVQKMANYWAMEPPIGWMYGKVHGFEAPEKEKAEMNMLPMTGTAKPWNKLPDHLKDAIRTNWLKDHPGKTEADFERQRKDNIKKKYARDLEEARKAKQNG